MKSISIEPVGWETHGKCCWMLFCLLQFHLTYLWAIVKGKKYGVSGLTHQGFLNKFILDRGWSKPRNSCTGRLTNLCGTRPEAASMWFGLSNTLPCFSQKAYTCLQLCAFLRSSNQMCFFSCYATLFPLLPYRTLGDLNISNRPHITLEPKKSDYLIQYQYI